jgi:putative membrane protein
MMNDMYDSYGWGMDWGMPFFGLFFWILFIVGIITLVRLIMKNKAGDIQESPLTILKKRYARGDIDQETYEHMKKNLES